MSLDTVDTEGEERCVLYLSKLLGVGNPQQVNRGSMVECQWMALDDKES